MSRKLGKFKSKAMFTFVGGVLIKRLVGALHQGAEGLGQIPAVVALGRPLSAPLERRDHEAARGHGLP